MKSLFLSKNGLYLDCHDHFQEIRFQIDQHREKLKEKIDDIYMEMIDETKEFEEKYLKNLNEELVDSLKQFEIKSLDEELKEIEETFRNPNILLKALEEMNLKQKESIDTLKLKLDEMVQVKEYLKAWNEFKPNLTFDKQLFGEYSSNPLKSLILTEKQPLELVKLCDFHSKDKFKLLYRASEDGFESKDFHTKCDGHANTLTILKANGFIFGAFTTAAWNNFSWWLSDPNAFLFSLTNKENKPCKMKIDPKQSSNAIYCSSEYGPIFGHSDIFISSNSNINNWCQSNLGLVYKHPLYQHGSIEAKSFLAGSYFFQLSEIEVYEKE